VQGLKPLALSSPSCVSLNGFYKKIKFPVFEWRERGRVSSLLVGLERRDAQGACETVVSWERIHRGLSETPPSHQSLGRPVRR